ncbi:MAG TPA: GNAT family protein [Chthoniobacterales bacterium]|jgi:ribosomal-protein-alanine N-acetyltransferase|nr:GNAT family protein [Chthoniobacterales bacterium]
MELKLERCTIRNWRLDDLESLAKHANNRRVWLGLRDRFPHPYGIEDAKEFLERATTGKEQEQFFCIEIDGCAVGGIGITIGEDVHRLTAEFGYWLAEEFWGQGVMSEVVPAFVNYSFDKFSLRRIFAAAYSNNPASARVLEKAGFVLEGRLRKNVIKDGQILDSLLYAKTM